ncbi:PIN domain-containing protein [Aureispira anguillae]|uniref:DUF4935 domain-containing protein n=1 Tax=Aureispira anguillae TaxID=2864201 RepID=A0A916DTA5_9BACT|nr:PIN domain-containing protein [Aureispira anguillae]BDS13089.1 hypothetical protein AsAng_0038170 [Aureispira anguillae]
MVNLILDTNTWIYLANGFNPQTNRNEEKLHFELIDWVIEKIQNQECRVFSNYIIVLEWKRNKESCEALIKKYDAQIKSKKNELRSKRRDIENFSKYAAEFKTLEEDLKSKIERNRSHIEKIEKILDEATEIPVEDSHRIKATELAIEKKAPFHHKNNSVADAIIFLSTADFFTYHEDLCIKDTLFISNNTSDFGVTSKSTTLHPDLAEMVKDKPIIFEPNLAAALKLGDSIIAKYQEYINYINRDCIGCLVTCRGEEMGLGEVEFDSIVKVKTNDSGFIYNPKQLLLDFGPDFKFTAEDLIEMENRYHIEIQTGECNFCDTLHLRCECGQEHAVMDIIIECGCGKIYKDSQNGVILVSELEEEKKTV